MYINRIAASGLQLGALRFWPSTFANTDFYVSWSMDHLGSIAGACPVNWVYQASQGGAVRNFKRNL